MIFYKNYQNFTHVPPQICLVYQWWPLVSFLLRVWGMYELMSFTTHYFITAPRSYRLMFLLACFTRTFHHSLSKVIVLQFLFPIFFKSSISSIHLVLGLPLLLIPYISDIIIFFCAWSAVDFLSTWTIYLNLQTLIKLTISSFSNKNSSVYTSYNSSEILNLLISASNRVQVSVP